MKKTLKNRSRIVLFALLIFSFSGINLNAQEGCPPWAQDRLKAIQQAVMEMVQDIGSPYSNNGARIAQLYQELAKLPPVCLRGSSMGGYKNRNYGNSPGSIYQDGGTIIAPGIAGCDGSGCVSF